jgi:aryl-alcohol dehydrogenase-like predicted oxidoreductase
MSSSKRLAGLVKAGKVRQIGLSNETPYGVHEFVRLAEQHGLPRMRQHAEPVLPDQPRLRQRPGRDLPPLVVSLLAYSPLGFRPADRQVRRQCGFDGPDAPKRPHEPVRVA